MKTTQPNSAIEAINEAQDLVVRLHEMCTYSEAGGDITPYRPWLKSIILALVELNSHSDAAAFEKKMDGWFKERNAKLDAQLLSQSIHN